MQIYVLDTNYDIIAYIDVAESTLWNKKFNDVGESEIYIPCDMEMLDILRRGHYLFRYDDDMFCKITKVEIETDVENGDYIIATAVDMSKILSGRIVRWSTSFSGKAVYFIKKIIEDNVIYPQEAQGKRYIHGFVFDMTASEMDGFTETIDTTVSGDDILQLIIATCKACNYGFRTSLDIDSKMLKFKLYKGVNRTIPTTDEYVEFSPAFGNIISSKYEADDSNYKNVAYVSYKSADEEDETVYFLSVYEGQEQGKPEPSDEARHEVYVDGTGTSRAITYENLSQMFPDLRKVSSSGLVDGKVQIESTYYSGDIAVATSLQEVKQDEDTEEKITVTDYTYFLLIRTLGYNVLETRKKTEVFTGEVDTIDSYRYKIDYDIGDIVKVINEYGIEANAQVIEIMESEDNDNGHVVEPRFQYVN